MNEYKKDDQSVPCIDLGPGRPENALIEEKGPKFWVGAVAAIICLVTLAVVLFSAIIYSAVNRVDEAVSEAPPVPETTGIVIEYADGDTTEIEGEVVIRGGTVYIKEE